MNYILSKRIINTPLEKLYEAYSNPDILIKWWGPHGFSNKFNEFTFAENGLWDYIMIDELGVEYHNQMIFKEIYPNKKIVADHISAPAFQVEIEFLKITSQQSEVFFKMKPPYKPTTATTVTTVSHFHTAVSFWATGVLVCVFFWPVSRNRRH
jgi:uncharacterized protein YndB with AHSA1/START domain